MKSTPHYLQTYTSFKKKILLIVLVLLMICPSQGYPNQVSPFFVLTVPKCGTHLLWKLVKMLTAKEGLGIAWRMPALNAFVFPDETGPTWDINKAYVRLEELVYEAEALNQFPIAHFNYSELFRKFSASHPHYRPIILVRDLRDACVSLVYFHWKELECELGPSTFDTKLLWVIKRGTKRSKKPMLNIAKNAREAYTWMQRADTCVVRFEDIVGPEGGGGRQLQYEAITNLANILGIHLDENYLIAIAHNLFGHKGASTMMSTFRDGKIGSWQTTFKYEHKRAFRAHLGKYQKAFGYSTHFQDKNDEGSLLQ